MCIPNLNLICAVSTNAIIGSDGQMPWHLPKDLNHFKELTKNQVVIMGRKTWDSLPKKPLVHRENIVLSHKDLDVPNEVVLAHTLDEVEFLIKERRDSQCFIIGGEQLYREFFFRAMKIYLTVIHKNFIGDAFFPYFSSIEKYYRLDRRELLYDEKEDCNVEFIEYTRI